MERAKLLESFMSADDLADIREVIASQFRSLDWGSGRPANFSAFARTFFPETTLIAAARPAKRQTVEEFIERMKRLEADGKLVAFTERMLGATVHLFGN